MVDFKTLKIIIMKINIMVDFVTLESEEMKIGWWRNVHEKGDGNGEGGVMNNNGGSLKSIFEANKADDNVNMMMIMIII